MAKPDTNGRDRTLRDANNDHRTEDWEQPGPREPDALVRLPAVIARVGLKRSAIYQRMLEGRFPKARSLGPRCSVWVASEIDDWIEQVKKMPNG